MILFFRTPSQSVIAVECDHALDAADIFAGFLGMLPPRLKTI